MQNHLIQDKGANSSPGTAGLCGEARIEKPRSCGVFIYPSKPAGCHQAAGEGLEVVMEAALNAAGDTAGGAVIQLAMPYMYSRPSSVLEATVQMVLM